MNTDLQWEKIKDIFQAALERDPTERQAYLDEACRNDPELRGKVESYLKAHEAAPSFLDRPINAMIPDLFEGEPFESMADKAIGVYRLTRELGRGGMGMVYLAQRSDGEYEKTVALKLIKRGLDSDEIVERFRHERQTLATLEHPNIARLLEGGRTEEGLPFFVMDYVEGDPIDAYCDEKQLNITARLRLFQKVCAAVQYAHQNSIVHRDLKPSNILVTKEGEPKLLDFGIAKVLSQETSPTQTQAGVRLMTLEYASPEQVRGERITTLSDVYSLGILLYRLLTGHSPYVLDETGTGALEKAILNQEPRNPSEAISRVQHTRDDDGQIIESVTPETVSAARAGTPDKLRHRLAGDVDSIVLKAMRKEPQERYSSVEQLSNDIEHHLSGHPVLARKGVWSYRASRFMRRHKFAVAAASVFLAMIIGFSISTQIQSQRIKQERDKAEQVSKFLVEIFQVSDPSEAKGDTITAREILDRGAERIANELKDQPLVQATLMSVIARVYQKLGLYPRADTLFEAALALRRQILGNKHVEVAQNLNDLGDLRRERDALASAEQLHREALAMRLELRGQKHPDVAESMNNLALVLDEKDDHAAAEPLYRGALAMQLEFFGPEHAPVVTTQNNLASLLQDKGKYDEAEVLFRHVLATRRKLLGERHHDVAVSFNNLALALDYQGKYEEADSLYCQALVIYRKLLGEKHPSIAICLSNLGSVSFSKGDYPTAAAYFSQALHMQQELLGAEHPDAVTNLNNLAHVLATQGNYAEAEKLFRQVVAADRKRLGDESTSIASSMSNLARVLHEQGKYEEAGLLLRKALAMRYKLLGQEHPSIATNLNNLAALLRDQGNLAAAEKLFREALAMRRQVLGEEHPEVAASMHNLADLFRRQRSLAAADSLCRQALALREKTLPPEHPDRAASECLLGMILVEAGSPQDAEPLLRNALEIQRAALAEGHWLIANTESILGGCLTALERYQEAESLLVKSYPIILSERGANRQPTLEARDRIVTLFQAQGKSNKIAQFLTRMPELKASPELSTK